MLRMSSLQFVVAIGLLLALVWSGEAAPGGAASAAGEIDGRVVGGVDAKKAQFPHQVSLRNRGSHSCGASIISRNWLLTAAHCVTYDDADKQLQVYPASQMTIRAGSNDRLSGGIIKQVAEIVVHEDYGDFLNDVALLRVATPFIFSSDIQPIALPSDNTPADADIIISGWGRLWQAGDLPRYMQWNTLRSLSLPACQEAIKYGYENMLCLSHEADNGACNGDSGGPAHYKNELVGVAGFVYGGCGTKNPDGYARVFYFKDWIKKHTDL